VGFRPEPPIQGVPYARYIAIGGIAILLVVLVVVLVSKPKVLTGIKPGTQVPAFAVPLSSGDVNGTADTAVHAKEGLRGKVPACKERGAGILNICELYERGPVVLALFIDSGSCANVLSEMQAASRRFPEVSFAAVALKGKRPEIKELVRSRQLSIPVGFDEEGAVGVLYRVLVCPQLSFISPGGKVQSKALLEEPSPAVLDERVSTLVVAARAQGWRPR
jgi:hypothetical protein